MSTPLPVRCDTFALARERQFLLSYPTDITPAEAKYLGAWLQVVCEKVKHLAALELAPPGTIAVPVSELRVVRRAEDPPPEISPPEPAVKAPEKETSGPIRETPPESSPPAHEVGGTLPTPKADVVEVATEGKAQPAATDRRPAEGEPKSNAARGRDNRQKLVDAIKAAGSSMTCTDLAKATGLTYAAAHAMLAGHDCFQKSPSGKWELSPKAAHAS